MKSFLKRHARVIALVAALVLIVTGGLTYVFASNPGSVGSLLGRMDRAEVGQSVFADRLAAGRIASLNVMGNRIEFTDRDGVNGVTTVLWTDALRQAVAAPGIDMNVEPVEGGALLATNRWLDVLLKLNMVGFLAFALVFMAGMMRSPVKKSGTATSTIRFADVAGVDEARAELVELVGFPQSPRSLRQAGRRHPQGRAAGRPSRHRQDPAGPRRGGGGGSAVLPGDRFRLRRDVCRRRRRPHPQAVPRCPQARSLHPVHRRDRRAGPCPWRHVAIGRPDRDREYAEPVAGRDGRFRPRQRPDRDRRHQPGRCAGPGHPPPRPVRPPCLRRQSRHQGPRRDPGGACRQSGA